VGFDRLGPVASVVATILVLGLLLVAFGVVAWEARKHRLALGVALAAVVVGLCLSIAAPLLLSRDAYSYAAYGRILTVHHADPYDVPPSAFPDDPFTPVVSREWFNTRSVYGPAFSLASGAIARLWSGSPTDTIRAFKVLSALGVLLAVAFVPWMVRRAWPGREALAVVLVGLNPVVLVHTVGGGHNDALVAGLLAAACLLGSLAPGDRGESRATGPRSVRTEPVGGVRTEPLAGVRADPLGGVGAEPLGGLALGTTLLIAVAVSVKVVAVLPLVYWWWTMARSSPPSVRARAIAAHVGIAAVVSMALAAPVFSGWRTVTAIADLASRQGWASGARLVARGAETLGRAMGGSSLGTVFGRVIYAAFLASFVLLIWRLTRTRDSTEPAQAWGVSLLLFALAAPYVLPWYAMWFLPFLALLSDERLAAVGLAVSGLVALTGIPAEPGLHPGLWRAMMLGVHYAVAPLVLASFVYAAKILLVSRTPASPAR